MHQWGEERKLGLREDRARSRQHEPPVFSAVEQQQQEQGPRRQQHPCVPRTPAAPRGTVVPACEDLWPRGTLGWQHQWLLPSAAGPSTTACGRQTCHGRWFETQQMWWRAPERSIAGSGTCWGLPSCFPAVLVEFLSVYSWYRQMSATKHGQAWHEILSVLVSYQSAALNVRPR